jgi:bacterioferritin
MVDMLDKQRAVQILNKILEMELAGVVRYTHFSLMVFGPMRLPIVQWLRQEAQTAMMHAQRAGEFVTHLGEHPSLSIGPLLESHNHDIEDILSEALEHERATLKLYTDLLATVAGKSVMLEEYSRAMVQEEESHLGEVDKMLRRPGAIASAV